MLRELSLPRPPGEFVKNAIGRASALAHLQYWRGFDLWYRKARRVEEYELDQIREALRIKNERAARNELHEIKMLLVRLEARLNAGDTDFYRADIDGLRAQVTAVGRASLAER